MVAELTALRDQIDEVDKALLDLLAKRLHLVAEVGEVKSRHGLPVYVPEREAAMLASRRQEAENLGVPPDLIEDVLRRVMRESYVSENDKGFKTQAFGIPLADLHYSDAFRADRLDFIQQLALDAFFQHRFQFETGIKMVFDRVFGGVSDQHNLVNPCRNAFIDDVLDQRFINQRQHFFWNGFGGR